MSVSAPAMQIMQLITYNHNRTDTTKQLCLKPQGKHTLSIFIFNLSATKCAQMMQKKNCAYIYIYSMQNKKMAM